MLISIRLGLRPKPVRGIHYTATAKHLTGLLIVDVFLYQ